MCCMRSSVIDEKSAPTAESHVFNSHAVPQSPNGPESPRPSAHWKPITLSRLLQQWTPFEGWMVLFLLLVALYCVSFSIVDANWVAHSRLLLWSPALGALIGLIVSKTPRMPQALLHFIAC